MRVRADRSFNMRAPESQHACYALSYAWARPKALFTISCASLTMASK